MKNPEINDTSSLLSLLFEGISLSQQKGIFNIFVDPIVKVLFNYNAFLSPGISVLEGDWVSPHQHIIIITL